MEKIGNSIRGIYRDILRTSDNRVVSDSGWKSNIIVDRCRDLLAAFMSKKDTVGVNKLMVGKGEESWDTTTPAPTATQSVLTDPAPFAVDVGPHDIVFLDENDTQVEGPTSRLQVTVTLGENQPPPVAGESSYPLREFGLFGQFTDNAGTVHDFMIDCVHHPVIRKDASTSLERIVRLYF